MTDDNDAEKAANAIDADHYEGGHFTVRNSL